jgi:hypothetical protein
MAEPASGPPPPTKDALRLETIVARGCLPYLLGQKSEKDALRGVALNHIHPCRSASIRAAMRLSG